MKSPNNRNQWPRSKVSFEADGIEIMYEEDYGIDKRKGWSVIITGSVESQFQPTLIEALQEALRSYEDRDEDCKIV